MKKKRNSEEDYDDCSFKPKITKSANEVDRSVDDLLRWGDEKRIKLASRRLSKLQEAPSFTPEISRKSKILTKDRKGELYDRLMRCADKKNEKIEEIRREYDRKFFKPQICENSRIIAAGEKPVNLHKIDNGRTENLDFYQAEPVGHSKSDIRLAGKSPNKGTTGKSSKKKKPTTDQKQRRHDPM